MKKKALEYLHLWAVFPPTELKLSEDEIRRRVAERVADLLREDNFCNHGHDSRPETPVSRVSTAGCEID